MLAPQPIFQVDLNNSLFIPAPFLYPVEVAPVGVEADPAE